jgi:hypothetical protein
MRLSPAFIDILSVDYRHNEVCDTQRQGVAFGTRGLAKTLFMGVYQVLLTRRLLCVAPNNLWLHHFY